MKKIFAVSLISIALISCSEKRELLKADYNEKNKIMIENNSSFSNVSVVGNKGAYLVETANEIAKKKKDEELKDKLNDIEGISVISDSETGIKASLQNDILFKFNSAEVSDKAKQTLLEFSKAIKEHGEETKLKITGHTDNIGTKEYNITLSQKRAEAVASVLKDNGIRTESVETVGKGFSEPVADNNSQNGRDKNRRVEIIIKK